MKTVKTHNYVMNVKGNKVIFARCITTGRFVKLSVAQAEYDMKLNNKNNEFLCLSGYTLLIAFICGYLFICFNGIFKNTNIDIFSLFASIIGMIGLGLLVLSIATLINYYISNIAINYKLSYIK